MNTTTNSPRTPSLQTTPHSIQPFDFHGSELRSTIHEDGSLWFVAADVCRALDIANTAQAVARLDDDERGVCTAYTLGGTQSLTTISESGLYSLVGTSRTDGAKAFKKWVTSVVLPSLRKRGVYIVGEETKLPEDMTPEELTASSARWLEQSRVVFAHMEAVNAARAAQEAAARVRHLENRQDRDEAHVSLNRLLRASYPTAAGKPKKRSST
jgi:prophage antirepressor-like protein